MPRSSPPYAPLDYGTLRERVEGTAAETGEAFFDALFVHLARAMGTKCAWGREWQPDRRRRWAVSSSVGEGYSGEYGYDIARTPGETVIVGRRPVPVMLE